MDLNYYQLASMLTGYHELSELMTRFPQASILFYASLVNVFLFLLNVNWTICILCACRRRQTPAPPSPDRGGSGQRALTYDINII